jgi:hypothetical protein
MSDVGGRPEVIDAPRNDANDPNEDIVDLPIDHLVSDGE